MDDTRGYDGGVDIREALSQAEEMREKLSADRDRIEGELIDLDAEIKGLRSALNRFAPSTAHIVPTGDSVEMFRSRSRTRAIEMVMGDATGPMTPKEVMEELASRGRDDDYNATSAAMAHLSRKGRIHSVGRAQWVIGPSPQVAPDEAVVHLEDEIDT